MTDDTIRLLGLTLRQRCRDDDDWMFEWLQVPFTNGYTLTVPGKRWVWRQIYAIKACVCIVLNRRRDLYASIDPGTVVVARFDWGGPWAKYDTIIEAWDWTDLVVAHGWRNWSFDTYGDSNA